LSSERNPSTNLFLRQDFRTYQQQQNKRSVNNKGNTEDNDASGAAAAIVYLNDLKLSSETEIRESWTKTKNMMPHMQYLNLVNALLKVIATGWSQGAAHIKEQLIKHSNSDALAYYNYILQRRTDPFNISKIPNKMFTMMTENNNTNNNNNKKLSPSSSLIDGINTISLLRLLSAKKIILQVIRNTLYMTMEKRVFKNHIRLCPNQKDPTKIKSFKTANNLIPNQSPYVESIALEFMSSERLDSTDIKDPQEERLWRERGFDLYASYIFSTRLIGGFVQPYALSDDKPLFLYAAEKGGLFMGQGQVEYHKIQGADTTKLGYEEYSGLFPDGIRLMYQTPPDKLVLTKELRINIFLNGTRDPQPLDILGAIRYQVLQRPLSDSGRKDAEFPLHTTKRPKFFKLPRNTLKNSYHSDFNLERNLSINKMDAQAYFEHILEPKNPQDASFTDLEAILYLQNINATDDLSLYVEWKAFESTPHMLQLMALCNYLLSQVYSGLTLEINKTLDMLPTGPSAMRQALKLLFPSGLLNKVDINL
jgi:hypothetical protein